ncbi:MBOAT family O-acyltransferase [Natranaerovirga hydrolytica]|nr:MBOAT family protein [Natranaerovirga hydrolytica]
MLLLAASYFFYMSWRPAYIILIVFSTVVDYTVAKRMHQTDSKKNKLFYLLTSLIVNLGLLFVFKYYNFFNYSLSFALRQVDIVYNPQFIDIILPVGISFYTFQTLSYTIDVYKGKKEPENHFGVFALFVSFFPQLVAGPIERSGSLIKQLKAKIDFDYENVTIGIKRIVWGLFKKVVIADRLAVAVDYVYNDPSQFTGMSLLVATVFFALQIYCDFSAYSDIAIGSAKVLGIDLMENFRTPYFSKSIQEFWRRWHISLSTWFKDYVFIPLGGSRVKRSSRLFFNILVVFLLSGLWHGAQWTFVIWGALHGLFMVIEALIKPLRDKITHVLEHTLWIHVYHFYRMTLTFFLVVFSWIFFRANNLSDALNIINRIIYNFNFSTAELLNMTRGLGLQKEEFYIALFGIMILFIIDFMDRKKSVIQLLSNKQSNLRWIVYYVITTATIWLAYTGSTQFVYFQF